MTEQKREDEIIIYLDDSSNTRAFKENQQVHTAQFKKVTEWIDKSVLQESMSNMKERLQETISILGSRGSGKTSFLLSIINKYQKDKDVVVMDIIDPTLIEQKGHIFLTIISQIKELVDNELKGCECNTDSSKFGKRQIWEKKLENLAHGLPSVDGVGQPNEGSWQDPEYIMHKGLRAVQSAKDLEKNFHEFIKESLNILNKKTFLLILDDIDVDFRKGWPVLETIRKYLTTPQIVTLLSGDIDLFAKAVRKQQWKNFGKELLVNEGDRLNRIGEYNDLVTEMESQYLQKVLKSQKRVRLNTLWEKWQMGIKNIKVSYQSADVPTDVIDYYKVVLKAYGIINPTQSKTYYSFLMSQPLRTQIQFLLNDKLIRDDKDRFTQTFIIESFLSNLYEEQVDIELANNTPELLNTVILKLLLKKNILSEAYQLQPTLSDRNINASLIALSLLFSEKIKENPFLIFDYIIKIGYTSNLVDALGYRGKNQDIISTISPSIEGLCEHAEMYQDNVLRNIVGNIIAYLEAYLEYNKNEQEFWGGIMQLYGFAFKAKKNTENSEYRIDAVFNNMDCFKKALAFFPISISKRVNNTSIVNYSVFTLFGAIGEFLKFENLLEISNHIQKLSQIRSYPMPKFKDKQAKYEESIIAIKDNAETDSNTELAQFILTWKKQYPKDTLALSPYLLGKIVTRFYYALGSIEERKRLDIGDAMHFRLIAFLNSVLLEDARENLEDISNLNHNNTNFSEDSFLKNITKIKKLTETLDASDLIKKEQEKKNKADFEKLYFSRWILSCPLILLYLNWDKLGEKEDFIWFITFNKSDNEKKSINDIVKKSIYDELCKVAKVDDKLPTFSGSAQNCEFTIQTLLANDKLSYLVIARKNLEEIKNKYLGTTFSKIEESSLGAFWRNVNQTSNLFLEWKAASGLSDDALPTAQADVSITEPIVDINSSKETKLTSPQ